MAVKNSSQKGGPARSDGTKLCAMELAVVCSSDIKHGYLLWVWGFLIIPIFSRGEEFKSIKDNDEMANARLLKGEGGGSRRIAKKPTTCNHIHVSQALDTEQYAWRSPIPAGKQLIGAL